MLWSHGRRTPALPPVSRNMRWSRVRAFSRLTVLGCMLPLGAGTLGGAHALHYQAHQQLDRLTTQFNMAGVLDDMGEWAEARQMYEEVVAGRTELLGPEARETLDAQWYLAMMLMDDSGEWNASRQMWGTVASGYASSYGQCHGNTQAARCCVCCCCMCIPFACCCGQRKRRNGGVDSNNLLDGDSDSSSMHMPAAP